MTKSKIWNKLLIPSLILNIICCIYVVNKAKSKYDQYKINNNKKVTYWLNRQNYLAKLNIKKSDIIFIGDSQTQQFELSEMFNDLSLKNRGINSDISKGVLLRINEEIKGNPHKIFIEIGINDINSGIEMDSTERNINKIIDVIQKECPNSKIYINGVFPSEKRNNASIIDLNNKINLLCRKEGIKFIDVYPPFVKDNSLNPLYDCGDKLHLSFEGYEKWKSILMPYVYE